MKSFELHSKTCWILRNTGSDLYLLKSRFYWKAVPHIWSTWYIKATVYPESKCKTRKGIYHVLRNWESNWKRNSGFQRKPDSRSRSISDGWHCSKDEYIPSDCYIRHQAEGIDIICSNIGLAGTEVQLVNAMSGEYVLKQILYGIKDQYDAVIIDCMPSLGMITINALAASDEVLIPVEASYLPIKGLQQLLKTIGKVRKQINPKLQVGGILFTMVDAHTNDARNNMELLRNI